MRLKEFNELTFDEKLFKVVDEGTFLDNYVTSDVRINLYSVHKFYVELVYNGDENKIEEIRSFKHGVHLDKYTK
jgi:hypothetical protein